VKDPQEAGRRLGVGAVLTGTVVRRGTQIVIAAELIDVESGARLWGERYERPAAELIQVQDAIAAGVVSGLRLQITPDTRRSLGGQGTNDPEAYELYLKARHLLLTATEEDDLEARQLFERAVAKDPRFVDALMGIVATHARSAGGGYAPPAEAWARADEALQKVLALDPRNEGARATRATMLLQRDWNWAAAEREFSALAQDSRLFLGPQYHPVALYFWARGRPDESVALMERALRLDPGNLESRIMLADFLVQAGRLDDAAAYYRAILDVAPGDPRPWFGVAEVERRRGDIAEAISSLRKAYELTEQEVGVSILANARTEAEYVAAEGAVTRRQLQDLEALADERYVSPLELGRLYAQVGEREKALAQLELALAERSSMLFLLKVDRAWDAVRDDPRFVAAVRRVGIP
jgi:tetratricopeptide (TPR) repeat protein